jgi:hypothetical protein
MPILIILLLAILIAQIGFWDTLGAILGGIAMVVLLLLILAAIAALATVMLYRRLRRRVGWKG